MGNSGWNRPAANQPTVKKDGVKTPSKVKGIVAGLVTVCALGGLCLWIFSGGDAKPAPKAEKKPARIKEVTPAKAPKAEEPQRELTDAEKRQKEIERYERIFAGREMPEGIKTIIYFLKNPPVTTYKVKVPHPYLKNQAERDIAAVVLATPGTEFLDVPKYGERFDQNFINAMVSTIEIEEDDDEETRRVKQDVTDVKKEIARICKEEGKKPSEVMNEYGKMMYDLGKLKRNIAAEVYAKRKDPNVSDEDVKDFFRAANVILEERGMPPMAIPTLANRIPFLTQRAAEREAAAAAQGDLSK